MVYLVMSIFSIVVVFLFIAIFLSNTKTSNSISLRGRILTIWHPLKKTKIHLENDLKTWSIKRIHLLWSGKVYALNLQLTTGEWRKIYFRSRSGKIKQLLGSLKEVAPNGKVIEDARLSLHAIPQLG